MEKNKANSTSAGSSFINFTKKIGRSSNLNGAVYFAEIQHLRDSYDKQVESLQDELQDKDI